MSTIASVVIPRPPRKGLLWLWLPPEEAKDVMTAFRRRHPRLVPLGLRLLGFRFDDTKADQQAILSSLRVVSFRPKAST